MNNIEIPKTVESKKMFGNFYVLSINVVKIILTYCDSKSLCRLGLYFLIFLFYLFYIFSYFYFYFYLFIFYFYFYFYYFKFFYFIFSQLNTTWLKLTSDDSLWYKIALNEIPYEYIFEKIEKSNWKNKFLKYKNSLIQNQSGFFKGLKNMIAKNGFIKFGNTMIRILLLGLDNAGVKMIFLFFFNLIFNFIYLFIFLI